jgi:hypothetical protein
MEFKEIARSDDSFVDLDFDITDDFKIKKKTSTKPKTKYRFNGKRIKYDDTTMVKYRILRERKMDVIFQDKEGLSEENAFVFGERWDPYTGKRIEKDPYGALYFNPVHLVQYYYTNRLNNLRISPSGDYEGYYGDAVGAGINFNIKSRGSHPERYLFRVPISDCYLTKSHNSNFITMGPKLTDKELISIDNLMSRDHIRQEYKSIYGRTPPSVYKMKQLYLQAIEEDPKIQFDEDDERDISDLTKEEIKFLKAKVNRNAVLRLSKV